MKLFALFLALIAAYLAYEVPCPTEARAPAQSDDRPEARQGAFAAVSDLQRTLLIERVAMQREQNDEERERLIADLSRQRIDFVAMLGDLVGWSGRSEWERFDALISPLRGLQLFPVFGNHDLMGNPSHFLARFPRLRKERWYARNYLGLRLIWLDSNLEKLGPEAETEKRWFESELKSADSDGAVKGVLVFLHHSPYSNSTVTGDIEPVKSELVPAFASSRKTLAMIGGHAHAYERFLEGGKTYLVIGGGGGPRVKLLEGTAQRHADLYAGPSPRPFHYLLVRPANDGVELLVRGFDKGESAPRELERLTLPWN